MRQLTQNGNEQKAKASKCSSSDPGESDESGQAVFTKSYVKGVHDLGALSSRSSWLVIHTVGSAFMAATSRLYLQAPVIVDALYAARRELMRNVVDYFEHQSQGREGMMTGKKSSCRRLEPLVDTRLTIHDLSEAFYRPAHEAGAMFGTLS